MISLADALTSLFGQRDWSPDERTSIQDVLDAARDWRAGRLPLALAGAAGEIATRDGILSPAGRSQCRAVLAASPSDSRRADLLAMLTALVSRQPNVALTNRGLFSTDDLRAAGVTVNARDPWNS